MSSAPPQRVAGAPLRLRLRLAGERSTWVLVGLAFTGILGGGGLHLLGAAAAGDAVWAGSTALVLIPLSWSVAHSLWRHDVGVDAIALIAIAGALALGEYLAGAVVALMLSGGNALEAMAGRRARLELTALLERAPRIAHRRRGELLEEIPVDEIAIGDLVLIRAGELVPVDGLVSSAEAVLDESMLTGESLPAAHLRGNPVRSGTLNAGEAFELRASRAAAESSYAAIVRLVQEAETQRAPFVRMADRYAAFFLPFTLVLAGVAWAASGDPVRALSVFVVATPCPLILAAPIALLCGVSRSARAGVIVKGAATIERLGAARSVLLDKTGTVTLGAPGIADVVSLNGVLPGELLRLAASVDQFSAHVLAEALVHGAQERGLSLSFPREVVEGAGQGIEGLVDGRRVAVGSAAWLKQRGYAGVGLDTPWQNESDNGKATILVGLEHEVAGYVVMADQLRSEATQLIPELRAAGIRHIALVTGDKRQIGEEIGRALGVDRVYTDQSPTDKLELVRAIRSRPELRPVVMVGDGVNDAPALALADVGIAMAAAGSTVSSETADAVVLVDRIGRILDAVRIGQRSLTIARQSVVAGLALSIAAMGLASFGLIVPVTGALLQEAIDVAVILNALRALKA